MEVRSAAVQRPPRARARALPSPPHPLARRPVSAAAQMCKRSVRAHQLKSCTPTYVEHLKCNVKLARAVDVTCRPQFVSLAQCLKGARGDASKCIAQATKFDVCTESW